MRPLKHKVMSITCSHLLLLTKGIVDIRALYFQNDFEQLSQEP